MPDGFICDNEELAVGAIGHFMSKRCGFVLKANYGAGGFSTLCYPSGQLQRGIESLQKDASRRMSFDHFWNTPPVIIEEYISASDASGEATPTIDLCILPDGTIQLIGTGSMIMRNGWLYSGIKCGLRSLHPSIESSMICIGREIGRAMSAIGYRGWFDVDFVLREDGTLFLTEINARRASPAHVFDIAKQLYGESWQHKCSVYANDHLPLQGSCRPSYGNIRNAFAEFNVKHEMVSVRAIPTIASSALLGRTPYLGYVVLTENALFLREFVTHLEMGIRESVGMSVNKSS
jgi:hypothetical protein